MPITRIQLEQQTALVKAYAELRPGSDCLELHPRGVTRQDGMPVYHPNSKGLGARVCPTVATGAGDITALACRGNSMVEEDYTAGASLGPYDGAVVDLATAMDATTTDMAKALENYVMGTTLVAAASHHSQVVTANVGDSRAYLVIELAPGQFQIQRMNRDHKPEDPDERALIEANGGRVTFDGHCHRVGNALNMSRSLGDRLVTGKLSQADLSYFSVPPDKRSWVILCSDGFTEVGNEETVRRIVEDYPPEVWAKIMAAVAFSNGSRDNISINVAPVSKSDEVIASFVADGHCGSGLSSDGAAASRYLHEPSAEDGDQSRFFTTLARRMRHVRRLHDRVKGAFPHLSENLRRVYPDMFKQLIQLIELRDHIQHHAAGFYRDHFLRSIDAQIARLNTISNPDKLEKHLQQVNQFAAMAQSFFAGYESIIKGEPLNQAQDGLLQILISCADKDGMQQQLGVSAHQRKAPFWDPKIQAYLQLFLFDNPEVKAMTVASFRSLCLDLHQVAVKLLEFDLALSSLPQNDFHEEMSTMREAIVKRLCDEASEVSMGHRFRADFMTRLIDEQTQLIGAMTSRRFTPKGRIESINKYHKACNKLFKSGHDELRAQAAKVTTKALAVVLGSVIGALIGFSLMGPVGMAIGAVALGALSFGGAVPASHFAFHRPSAVKKQIASIAASVRPRIQ